MADTQIDATQSEPKASTIDVEVGQRFADRYVVEALLGRGGMGAVYRAHDVELDEPIALKLLDHATDTPDAIERFRREVRLARRVTHRNAARTYDLGEHAGQRFLTMEYVDGESLAELSQQRRLDLDEILSLTRQIASGLAAAHAAQVVHRDLKPGNVLVEQGEPTRGPIGRAVITDFGIARGLHGSDATLQTHGTLGTPAYMAPEQLAGETVTSASDIYSLALITHELLVGELPYRREKLMETALARLHETPPDLTATHDLDPDFAQLLSLMLSREPAERPPAVAVIEAILGIEAEREAERATNQDTITRDGSENSIPTALVTRQLALAVLPFSHRGPKDTVYIGEALSDELVDVLAMTKGLRVSGSGATARYALSRDRDPRTIGAELGVDALVDGTVQVSGDRVRISARLLEGATGFQRWTERFEGSLSDVFELQDKMGKRIAEALRVEVEQSVHRGDSTPEAIEHYLRARQLARVWAYKGPDGAIAQLQQALALAPSFKPALAAYAHACLRAWFLPRDPGDPDFQAMAQHALETALGWAPELAETHLAAARWATATGDYRSAAQRLQIALSIAPTFAAAHAYIGQLQVEGGRPREGIEHLELALELDPSLVFALPAIGRYHALRGDLGLFDEWIARFFEVDPRPTEVPIRVMQLRVGAWFDDRERIDAAREALTELLPADAPLLHFVALSWREDLDHDELLAQTEALLPVVPNPDFRGSMLQMACETALRHGDEDLALRWLTELGIGPLADIDWLEHCVVLEPLHEQQLFRTLVATARARAEAIWWR